MATIDRMPEPGAEKLRGRDRRSQNLSTKLTREEEALLESASSASGKTPSEWARDVLLHEARSLRDPDRPEALLTEIVGLQLFLTNVLSPVACGERITPSQYEELMQQVKANKRQATREVIAQHVAERKERVHD